jgi:hypothetical protein
MLDAYHHVIQLMLIRAPDGIVQAVVLAHEADALEGVVCRNVQLIALPLVKRVNTTHSRDVQHISLLVGKTVDSVGIHPHLDVGVFDLSILLVAAGQGNGDAVEVLTLGDASHLEEGGQKVNVCSDSVAHVAFGNARAANVQGNINILFHTAGLTGRQTVLRDVVPIVAGEDDIRVIEQIIRLQPSKDLLNHFVDRLK